jgi:hypothetical protein
MDSEAIDRFISETEQRLLVAQGPADDEGSNNPKGRDEAPSKATDDLSISEELDRNVIFGSSSTIAAQGPRCSASMETPMLWKLAAITPKSPTPE